MPTEHPSYLRARRLLAALHQASLSPPTNTEPGSGGWGGWCGLQTCACDSHRAVNAGAGTWAPPRPLPSMVCHFCSLSPPGWGRPPPPGSPAHPTGRRGPGSRRLGLTGFLGKDLQGGLGQREASRAPLCHLWTATGSPETRRSSGCHLCQALLRSWLGSEGTCICTRSHGAGGGD